MNSPNGHGVRLKTDLTKIYKLMPSGIQMDFKEKDIINEVKYLKEDDIKDKIKKSFDEDKITFNSVMKLFFLKEMHLILKMKFE